MDIKIKADKDDNDALQMYLCVCDLFRDTECAGTNTVIFKEKNSGRMRLTQKFNHADLNRDQSVKFANMLK